MKLRLLTLHLLTFSLVLCSGCMTYRLYDGDKRPQGELATIKLGVILEIDGGNLQYLTGHNLVVHPGRHSLGLTLKRGKESAVACTFDVTVEAGHVYVGVVEHDLSGSGKPPVLYVKDKTANLVVARHPPLPVARTGKKSIAPAPAILAKAESKSATRDPIPASQSRLPANSPTWRNQPVDPKTLAELRRLRQLKTDGIITNEEYLQRGYALVGSP